MQSAIARLESESYGKWGTNTLIELANAFDVALEIRFVGWPQFMKGTTDASPAAMSVPSFSVASFYPANAYQRQVPANQTSRPAVRLGLPVQHADEPRPTPLYQGERFPSQIGA